MYHRKQRDKVKNPKKQNDRQERMMKVMMVKETKREEEGKKVMLCL